MVWPLCTTIGEGNVETHETMSTSPHEAPSEPPTNTLTTIECIAAFEREDGAVVIYDERKHTAWIQSMEHFDIEAMR